MLKELSVQQTDCAAGTGITMYVYNGSVEAANMYQPLVAMTLWLLN